MTARPALATAPINAIKSSSSGILAATAAEIEIENDNFNIINEEIIIRV